MRRILILADPHCGHMGGLTPPGFQFHPEDEDQVRAKFALLQRAIWDWYSATVARLQPIDTLIVNGDSIDGKGDRSGGTEQITTDRRQQVRMAAAAIGEARARRVYLIRGTPYHTGKEEDWEDVLAGEVGAAHIGDHDWFEFGGVTLDCKHKISSSIIPHGRYTALSRDALWNALWAERKLQPRAGIVIRSHVHYFVYCGDRDKLAITTPCLQGWSKFGVRQCSGTVDLGLIYIDIGEDGGFSWKPELMDLQFMARPPLPL